MSSEPVSRPAAAGFPFAPASAAFTPFLASEVEQSIGSRFEKISRAHPDRPAIRHAGRATSYAELDAASNRIARAMASGLAGRPGPVALVLDAGASLVSAMLGALKAARFYVPLDPGLAPERRAAIWASLDAAAILTDETGRASARDLAADRSVPVWSVGELAADGPSEALGLQVDPDAVAYVLFTSGSTGPPKGVMQSHRNLLHNILKLTNGLRIGLEDRLTLLSSPSFGASTSDIFGALLNGACLCPFSLRGDGLRRLPDFLAREGITIYHSVPSVFRSFAATLESTVDLSRLRLVKLGGEAVLASDFELYRRRFPKTCVFHVGLGATEMSVIRQWFARHETPWPGASPLGYAVDGTEVVLLDEEGRETQAEGEIAVIARTLPVGYWKDPARTREAFAPAPGRPGARLYRTGDLGRLLPDGCLLHAGRKDRRVKVRGQRVELEEVESALAGVSGVREAAVVAREGAAGTRLVAFVVADSVPAPGVGALRRALARRLPDYMIPSSFAFLGELPRTATGKVDRGALPSTDPVRPTLETPYVAPRDDREAAVARVFAEALELDCVGADDDFFDLGGSSLSAVEALSRLSDLLETELSAADLIEAPTPSALALKARWRQAPPAGGLVRLSGGQRPPVFLIPGGAGDGADLLASARLARRVGSGFPFLGFRFGPPPHPPLEELAERCLQQIRAALPRGPHSIVGECVGGVLAIAVARRLREEGQPPALLALLDTPCPTAIGRLRRSLRRLALIVRGGRGVLSRLRRHVGLLWSMDASLRRAYAAEKARVAARALGPAARSERRHALARRGSYAGRLQSSRPARFDGPICLVQSEEGKREGFGAAWAKVAPHVQVVTVPGDHASYLREHVDGVADVLRGWLDQSGRSGAEAGDARAAFAARPLA